MILASFASQKSQSHFVRKQCNSEFHRSSTIFTTFSSIQDFSVYQSQRTKSSTVLVYAHPRHQNLTRIDLRLPILKILPRWNLRSPVLRIQTANKMPSNAFKPEDQLTFLLSCIRYSNSGKVHLFLPVLISNSLITFQVDFGEVAKEMGLASKGAA